MITIKLAKLMDVNLGKYFCTEHSKKSPAITAKTMAMIIMAERAFLHMVSP